MAVGGWEMSRWWLPSGTCKSMTTGQYRWIGFWVGAPKRPRSKSCWCIVSFRLPRRCIQACITGCAIRTDPRGCSRDGTDPRSQHTIESAACGQFKRAIFSYTTIFTTTPQISLMPCDSESNQDTVVNARRLPSATYARDSRPSGNAMLLWWVPEFIQQKLLQTIPKCARPPVSRFQTDHSARTMPMGSSKSWAPERSMSNAWAVHLEVNADGMCPTPAKNSTQWTRGICSSDVHTCHMMLKSSVRYNYFCDYAGNPNEKHCNGTKLRKVASRSVRLL